MSFVIKKLRIAEDDAVQAAAWYDEREAGLGDDFLKEVDAAALALTHDALMHRVRFGDVRRAPIRRFKFYGIYYLIRQQGRIRCEFQARTSWPALPRTKVTR